MFYIVYDMDVVCKKCRMHFKIEKRKTGNY
jgi:hypothetical protein